MRSPTTLVVPLLTIQFLMFPSYAATFAENFAKNLYDGTHSANTKDYELVISVAKDAEIIGVHSEVFKRTEELRQLFTDAKQINFPLKSKAEVSALKKVIYFLYKNPKPEMVNLDPTFAGFFEAQDLAELILFAWKYRLITLSQSIALALREQIERRINRPTDSILLDQFPQKEFQNFYSAINSCDPNVYKQDPHAQSIKASIDHYVHFLHFTNERKLKEKQINPVIYRQIELLAAPQKKKREEAEFARQKVKIASEISEKLRKDFAKKGAKARSYFYRVPKNFQSAVKSSLQKDLPNFRVAEVSKLGRSGLRFWHLPLHFQETEAPAPTPQNKVYEI